MDADQQAINGQSAAVQEATVRHETDSGTWRANVMPRLLTVFYRSEL
jgi:hypothetical protein